MRRIQDVAVQSSNFNLKHEVVELIPTAIARTATISVQELEAQRVNGAFIPASKHGLEVVCGASCETGAQ